jgi:glycosyltransferase involved in cell wall biosynthesis
MPAYNASQTLSQTYQEIPRQFIDEVLLVDDGSVDGTLDLARKLGIATLQHASNRGYGANQKTCYKSALEMGGDIIIMLHPDYQYTPSLIPAIATMLVYGPYDVVLGSRILTGGALKGGMPLHKYASNRVLTGIQNLAWRTKLSEFHTGLRGFRRYVLTSINLDANSDDFVFDNQIIAQILRRGYRIGEVSCPTYYHPTASSISLQESVVYGIGVLKTTVELLLAKSGIHTAGYLELPAETTEKSQW